MKMHALALATGLTALTLSYPAAARPGHDHHDRQQMQQQHRGQQMQRQRANAYRQGFRDGARTSSRSNVYSSGRYRSAAPVYYRQAPVYYSTPPRHARASYNNQYWWGQNGRMNCRRQDGTTGTIVGAVAGGVLGNMIAQQGDKQMGTVIGGALGALLGNQIAKGNVSCR